MIHAASELTAETTTESEPPIITGDTVTDAPKPDTEDIGRFVPPDCSACKAFQLPSRKYTYVNGRETKVNTTEELIISRNIKCKRCLNSWMHYEVIKYKKGD